MIPVLNQYSNEYLLISELEDIKALLAGRNPRNTSSSNQPATVADVDDLYIQYPESTNAITIAAGETVNNTLMIKRKLKCLCFTVPVGVTLTIKNNNSVLAWFTDKAGTLEFPNGIYIESLTVEVVNSTAAELPYSVYMIFS